MRKGQKPYEARGVARRFLDAVADDPARVWSTQDACDLMGIQVRRLYATMAYPVKNGLVFQAKRGGRLVLSGTPFKAEQLIAPKTKEYVPRGKVANGWLTEPDDPRIGKVVPGWKPPTMVSVRLGG